MLETSRCHLDVTIHWCLKFNQPLSHVPIKDETPCTLHGMVLWQNLNMFLGTNYLANNDQMALKELTGEENSVVRNGISCSIGELRTGEVKARLTLELPPQNETQNILRDVSWKDIAKVPLKRLLASIKKKIQTKRMEDTNIVSLAGLMNKSGYIGQRSLKYRAAFAAARGVPLNEIPLKQVYNYLANEIVNKKEYIRHGSSARISLYNGAGEIVESRTVAVSGSNQDLI